MNKSDDRNNSFSLEKVLTLESVKAKASVESWEQAANIVGELLINSKKVEPRYVTRMKQALAEIGPYVVVAPGIALLHARPEDGVLEPCISLITLDTPVDFGHSENDPVDIVIAFGATNKITHIPALKRIADQLSESEIVDKIRSAKTDKKLLEAFLDSHQDVIPEGN